MSLLSHEEIKNVTKTKMDEALTEIGATKLLKESILCRLCGEENISGINIFTPEENGDEISQLINRYLPVKVEQDDEFPKTICPGCHIQLEATKLFMDLIVEGQAHLRELFKIQKDHLQREEQQRLKLEEALKVHNPDSSVETCTIQTDQTGEIYIIQIFSNGPLFNPEHELALKADGLDRPKKKRGRPPKPPPDPAKEQRDEDQAQEEVGKDDVEPDIDSDGRRRRKIKAPLRYEGVVHGKELDKMLKKEGVIDDDDVDTSENTQNPKTDGVSGGKNFIGTLVTGNGDYREPVFHNRRPKMKTRMSKNGLIKRHKRYECEICKKEFLHLGTYRLHVNSHQVRFICKHEGCSESNEDILIIQNHQLETGHSGISAIEDAETLGGNIELPLSTIPPTNAKDPKTVLSDTSEKLEEKQIVCELCNKTFTCKQNYEVHIRAVHTKERPFRCDYCSKSFSYANSLKVHTLRHISESKTNLGKDGLEYKCEKCNKIFHHPSSLCYHRDTEHSNGRRFVCSKCDKSFKHRQLLQRHQLVHTEERPFHCTQCFQTFKTKASLLNHQAIHTGLKKFVCMKCGQNFAHRTSLSLHQRWHDGYKPFECDVCHKSFSQKGNLAEHKRIHTGEKPYCCDHCGRSFTTSSQYKLHIKRHTGEKPWRCEYCSKTFLHRDTWKTHTRRHLNERPFKCKFCPRAFTESWALRRHERLHSGEKPYKCTDCGKCFADSSNMTKHKKMHRANAEKTVFTQSHTPIQNGTIELLDQITENVEEQDNSNLISILDSSVTIEKEEQAELNPLELRQVLDSDGNPIRFTTTEGQPISIVSSGSNQKIQGLLPDGSLIALDLTPELEKATNVENEKVDLLNGIQFLTNESPADAELEKTSEKTDSNQIQFLTEDGKVCFITYDDSEFLTMT